MPSRRESQPQLLLIESEAPVRRGLQLLLQGKGYQVLSFASASAALADQASVESPYVVVDYSMPYCDGIEALQTLKARGWRGVAVLITAFFSETLRAQAISAGFAELLSKPFSDEALLEELAGVVEGAS